MLILVRIHRVLKESYRHLSVVNCFQNANFSEDSQGMDFGVSPDPSCELLSEC